MIAAKITNQMRQLLADDFAQQSEFLRLDEYLQHRAAQLGYAAIADDDPLVASSGRFAVGSSEFICSTE